MAALAACVKKGEGMEGKKPHPESIDPATGMEWWRVWKEQADEDRRDNEAIQENIHREVLDGTYKPPERFC